MQAVKVLIADDHPLIRQGLVKVINFDPEIEVVGEACDGEDVIKKAAALRPDLILMDLNMPKLDGLEAARIIRDSNPEVQIIALTVEDSEQKVMEVIKCGVRGYILKDVEPDALISTVKAVHTGETVIHPRITSMLFRELERHTGNPADEMGLGGCGDSGLTPRETEILEYLAKGVPNKEIASRLFISEKTVKNHITSIFKKLQAEDRTQAVLSALKMKLVHL